MALLDQIAEHDIARLGPDAEEPRSLWRIQAQSGHFAIHTDDERHKLGTLRFVDARPAMTATTISSLINTHRHNPLTALASFVLSFRFEPILLIVTVLATAHLEPLVRTPGDGIFVVRLRCRVVRPFLVRRW
jgi:hypothetical protein